MSTLTPKLGLIKPTEGTDFVDVDQINTNMDTIDAKLGALTEDSFVDYVPTLSGWNGTVSKARYKAKGKEVTVYFSLLLTAATGGAILVGLPFAAHASYSAHDTMGVVTFVDVSVGNRYIGSAVWDNANRVRFQGNGGGAFDWDTAGRPIAWSAGDVLSGVLTYERA